MPCSGCGYTLNGHGDWTTWARDRQRVERGNHRECIVFEWCTLDLRVTVLGVWLLRTDMEVVVEVQRLECVVGQGGADRQPLVERLSFGRSTYERW